MLPGALRARQPLGDRHRRGDSHRPLRAVLVAVKGAHCSAQRVVLDDHAQVRRAVVALVARHEGRLQAAGIHLDLEAVLLQILLQLLDRPLFDESDFRMPGDVVRHRQQFFVHQLLRPRHHLLASRIRQR